MGAVAEGYGNGHAPFGGVKRACFGKGAVHVVVVEAFDGAAVDADERRACHHVGKGDIGLLAAPVKQGALVIKQVGIVGLEAAVFGEGFADGFRVGDAAAPDAFQHKGAVVAGVFLGEDNDDVAGGVQRGGHASCEGFEFLPQLGVLHDEESPWLAADGAGGEAGEF